MPKKTLKTRNIVTHYIRKDYIPVYELFKELIEKDERIIALRNKKSDKLTSIAIQQLILKYVKERTSDEELKTKIKEGEKELEDDEEDSE